MRSRLGAIKACYDRALKHNPTLGGKIVVRFEISTVGKVTKGDDVVSRIAAARTRPDETPLRPVVIERARVLER